MAYTKRHPHPECLLTPAMATALAPGFVDDFDWSYVSPDGLSVAQAFAMATQWATQLQGHAGCAMHDRSKGLRVLPNLEWIQVNLGCCEEETSRAIAMAARASVMVWQAIAACRGFELQENSGFWRRVFDEIYRASPKGSNCDGVKYSSSKSMTDEVQLFDGVPFPRLVVELWSKLDNDTVDHLVRVLASGLPARSRSACLISEELKATLNHLNAFSSFPQSGLPEMQVSLGVGDMTEHSWVQRFVTTIESRHTIAGGEERGPVARLLSSQRWKVTSMHLRSRSYTFDATKMSQTVALGRRIPVQLSAQLVNGLHGMPDLELRRDLMWYVRWALGAQDNDGVGGGGVRCLLFRFQYRPEGMAAICSALPHTKSLTGFEMYGAHPSDNDVGGDDVAWLAYALFHPDSSSSTWEEYEMTNLYYRSFSFEAHQVISMMAKGNNLHVVLGLSTVQTDRYFTATIREGAVVYATLPSTANSQVLVIDKATIMDVCVTTTDLAAMAAWVPVIVVGFGVAYVASSFILGITARAPGRSFLKRMRLKDADYAADLLIRLCGCELEYLDYSPQYQAPSSLKPLHDTCPKLTSYRLSGHHKALREWKPPPALRELEVRSATPAQLIDRLEATFLPMTSLETLSLKMKDAPRPQDIDGFVLPLLRGLKQLRRFYWMTDSPESDLQEASYAQRRSVSRLMIPGLVKGKDDVAVLPKMPTAVLVTLLSVVRYYSSTAAAQTSVIGQLDQDLVAWIGDFVGTVVPRELWIDGSTRWGRTLAAGVSASVPSATYDIWEESDY